MDSEKGKSKQKSYVNRVAGARKFIPREKCVWRVVPYVPREKRVWRGVPNDL